MQKQSNSQPEELLISYIRDLKWGSLEITVQAGKPVFIKHAYRTVKLTPEENINAK